MRPPFTWSFPYPSQRMPVMARNVVATSQPTAAQAGLDVLRDGGNAVDAAIATAIVLTVVEPTSNGIGSDAFALIWRDGKLHGLNASGRAPAALRPSRFAGRERVPLVGWDPVTVPGAVSAWIEASRRFGSLPLERLFAPAIDYAERGYLVAPQTASSWAGAPRRWPDMEAFAQTFLPGGRAPAAGERFVSPDHGRTLRAIAETRGEAFYRGPLAERIAADAKAHGGLMTTEDLAAHRADWVEPIAIDYRGYDLHEIPPNGQGLAALLMLGIVRHHPLADLDPDCPDALHLQIEAMKLAFADGRRYIADPDHVDVEIASLLDPAYLAERARLIDRTRARDFDHGRPKAGGTVLLTAADEHGTMVTFIQSNYTGFGSGVVIPGTGISMQNRGACFTVEPGHPNEASGGKRPYHTIIPAFVTRGGEPVMAFGVMGGHMQPQGHAQVMIRLVDHGQNPQAALDAPRWQVTEGRTVLIEPGFQADVYETLRDRGHDLQVASTRTVRFGGGQAIWKLDDGYLGASDLRRDGQAVGFDEACAVVPIPPAILAIGRNYAEHAAEMHAAVPERPLVFMKNPASVIASGAPIVIPPICAEPHEQVDYEGELAVILGADAKDVPEPEVLDRVAAYAVANDVSARWWQKKGAGGQFVRGKSFDTFCPLSAPVPAASVPDPQALRLVTRLNGEVVQDGHTRDMIHPVARLVAELSRGTTLLAGTVILTGTPAGVGAAQDPPRFLRDGDEVEITIDGVGTLRNPVRG